MAGINPHRFRIIDMVVRLRTERYDFRGLQRARRVPI